MGHLRGVAQHDVQVHRRRVAAGDLNGCAHGRSGGRFYRAGDGNDESFNGQMIVSASDLDPALPGDQHVWIQGVGCGSAGVSFGA